MSCRLINSPLTGKEIKSATWDDLRNLVSSDEEADRLYDKLLTPEFMLSFGNWVSHPESVKGEVNEIGEPLAKYASDSHFLQQDSSSIIPSKASAKTLSRIEDFLDRAGVDVEKVNTILINGQPVGAQGVAFPLQGLISVVNGTEASTLPEEAMHIAVELLEQKDPALFKAMFNKIGGYKLFSSVVAEYKDNKAYQLPNGKPDVRKLKKEAMAKVLAEYVIKAEEGEIEQPQNIAQVRNWWQQIKDFLSRMFAIPGYNPFEDAAKTVLDKDLGTTKDLTEDNGPFFQSGNKAQETYEKLKEVKVTKVEPQTGDSYYVKPDGIKVAHRVTDRTKKFYDEKYRDKQKTQAQIDEDELSKNTGIAGHGDLEEIQNRYIDKATGFPRRNAQGELAPIHGDGVGRLLTDHPEVYRGLELYMKNLIDSYPTGTRFMAETIIYDEKADEAGTIDFLAILPSGVVDILDWKFQKEKKFEKDISDVKKEAYNIQLNRYAAMLKSAYGVEKIGKNRIIPIQVHYSWNNTTKATQARSIKIGSNKVTEITDLKLMPLPVSSESIDSPKVAVLLSKLNAILKQEQEKKKTVSGPQRQKAEQDIANLIKAIRQVQIGNNLVGVIQEAKNTIKEARDFYEAHTLIYGQRGEGSRHHIPFNRTAEKALTDEQVSIIGAKVSKYLINTNAFLHINNDFKNIISGEAGKAQLEELKAVNEEVKAVQDDLRELQLLVQDKSLGARYGIHNSLIPETEIGMIAREFRGSTDAVTKGMQLMYRVINNARQKWEMDFDAKKTEMKAVFTGVKSWMNKQGKDGHQHFMEMLFRKAENGGWEPKIVSTTDVNFKKQLKDEIGKENHGWIKDNIDMASYKADYEKQKAQVEEFWHLQVMDESNEENNIQSQQYQIDQWITTHDIFNHPQKAFNNNNYLLGAHPNMEKWTNPDYAKIKAIPELLAFHNYMRQSNEEAHQIGLTEHRKQYFFPQKRADFIEQLLFQRNGRAAITALGDSLKVKDNEYGYVNPLTNEIENRIFAHYQNSLGHKDKDGKFSYELASQDIFVVLQEWEYEKARYNALMEVEGSLRTIRDVERNKKHLVKKVRDGVVEYSEEGGNDKNTDYMEEFMKSLVYRQPFASGGDAGIATTGAAKLVQSVAGKINQWAGKEVINPSMNPTNVSFIKTIEVMNRFYNLKTMTFNLGAGIANAVGGNFNALINAGKDFTAGDYNKAFLRNATPARFEGAQGKRDAACLIFFKPHSDDMRATELNKMSFSKAVKILNSEYLRILNTAPDRNLADNFTLAMADNTIVEDGKLVNIRRMISDKYSDRYNKPQAELRAIEKKMAEEIAELKKRAVSKIIEVVNDEVIIPGIDRKSKDVFTVRDRIQASLREATGSMTPDEIALYSRNLFLKGFMMFKGWIRPLFLKRFGGLEYYTGKQDYDYGRLRMIYNAGLKSAYGLLHLFGAHTGEQSLIGVAKRLYEQKSAEFEKRGDVLKMGEHEFIQMYLQGVKSQMTEFLFFAGMLGLYMLIKHNSMGPDDDPRKKGLQRWGVRMADKISDEFGFFYNPMSFEQMASGKIFPAVGLLTDFIRFMQSSLWEGWYDITGNDDAAEKNHVLKYPMKMLPILKEMNNYLPLMDADLAKDLGLQITGETVPH